MFPDAPYSGFTWHLTQHMGVVNPTNLYPILWAAATFRDLTDPALRINEYLVANSVLTANIRSDSGQADAWRDYQQFLSELGLIFSTEVVRRITPTPLGLAYLDGSVSFEELITLQCLRYQYPNGHKVVISTSLRSQLANTRYATTTNLARLQQMAGVQIRPAVLVWQILRGLDARGDRATLTVDELRRYLMRCATHGEAEDCVDAIISSRYGGPQYGPVSSTARNAQDWIKFLQLSPLFGGDTGSRAYVGISNYGRDNAAEIDEMCSALTQPNSFWNPTSFDGQARLAWYSFYGTVDVDIPLIPQSPDDQQTDVVSTHEESDDKDVTLGQSVTTMRPRDFDPSSLGSARIPQDTVSMRIQLSYDAGLSNQQHRLHDLMVLFIADVCRHKGARLWDDPSTLDLLVEYKGWEFIIEVKSVTPRNFLARVRYALGQVLHYDYLRSLASSEPRRKVIAVAAHVPDDSWCVPFITEHVDADLLSLQAQTLRVRSRLPLSQELFTPDSGSGTIALPI